MRTFRDKTILLTGASGGIGEAMARQLADPSVTLLLVARSEDKLHALADELSSHGTRAHVYAQDLAAEGAPQRLYDRITGDGRAVDVLINNAGVGRLSRFEGQDPAVLQGMMTLNMTNLVLLTRLFLPEMLERGDAGVLNVASTAAYQPLPHMAVYAATKAFVLSFSEALHAEMKGRGVTVTCLAPGFTETGFQGAADMDASPVPDALLATPEEVAETGLKALLDGKVTKVHGTPNALGAAAARVLPRRLVARVTERLFG